MQFYLQKERQVSHSTFKLHLKKKGNRYTQPRHVLW